MKTNNNIIIKCWSGKILFEGSYKDPKVDEVLEANRCKDCNGTGELEQAYAVNGFARVDHIECPECSGTGYSGDFSVHWQDSDRKDNVFEFINY